MTTNDNQDWKEVRWTGGSVPGKEQNKINEKMTKINYDSKFQKLDSDDPFTKKIQPDMELKKQIQQARMAKNMTQKDLAKKLNIQAGDINLIESGKKIPTNQEKQIIERVLGVKFKTKKNKK